MLQYFPTNNAVVGPFRNLEFLKVGVDSLIESRVGLEEISGHVNAGDVNMWLELNVRPQPGTGV
jgi:hypothetical protein